MNKKIKPFLNRALTVLFELISLNFLWAVCSIPIVTIGPATSALFAVMLKVARDEPVLTLREFFSAFVSGFKQSFFLGLIMLFGAAVVCVDVFFGLNCTGNEKLLFFAISGVISVICLVFWTYCFPLQARFQNTLRGHIKNAFALALLAPGKTILMLLVWSAPVILLIFLPFKTLTHIGWLYIIAAVSGPALINSYNLLGIFDKIVGEEKAELQ